MRRVFLRGRPCEFENYLAALTACGLEPVLSMDLHLSQTCDGLLLPGGADVDPMRYGQQNCGSVGIDLARDEDEWTLLHEFLRWERPILGICRGCQMMNIALGGSLHQDILNHSQVDGKDRVHMVRVQHPVFRELYGGQFVSNSAHHQSLDRLGEGLAVLCRAEDGTIEGVMHDSGIVLGVQFHPERMAFAMRRPDAADGEAIFRHFAGLVNQ